jgi:hypothetical protein
MRTLRFQLHLIRQPFVWFPRHKPLSRLIATCTSRDRPAGTAWTVYAADDRRPCRPLPAASAFRRSRAPTVSSIGTPSVSWTLKRVVRSPFYRPTPSDQLAPLFKISNEGHSQRTTQRTFILPAVGSHTNPKRKRGPQPISSLTLRVSISRRCDVSVWSARGRGGGLLKESRHAVFLYCSNYTFCAFFVNVHEDVPQDSQDRRTWRGRTGPCAQTEPARTDAFLSWQVVLEFLPAGRDPPGDEGKDTGLSAGPFWYHHREDVVFRSSCPRRF